jgi:hypothetical protein
MGKVGRVAVAHTGASHMSANSVWLIVISATIGGFISQFITEFIRWMTKPRLRFQTASKIPFVIVAPLADDPTTIGKATWIRVRVHNRGWRDAESCRVYLTDIFREDKEESILKDDAFPLWASAGGDGDPYASLSISRRFGRFFDIGFITNRQLTVASKEFPIRRREPLPPGTYKLGIAASGTNVNPITGVIKLRFDGVSASGISVSLE